MLGKGLRFFTTLSLVMFFANPLYAKVMPSSDKHHTTHLTPAQVADALGWVPYTNNDHICRGFYKELPITMPTNAVNKETVWHADRAVLWQKKRSHAHGNVVLTQAWRQITGNNLISYPNKKTNRPEKLDIYGNVHLRESGMLAVGTTANLNVEKKSAVLHNATFRYQMTPQAKQRVLDKHHQLKEIYIKGKSLRGHAKTIQQLKPKLIKLQQATITTCDPYSHVWQLKSSSLLLDQKSGVGTARNARLLLHGLPILYMPYFRFPIDNRRRSGFLMPSIGRSSNSGLNLSWPYYWNLAPNYDMTITPNYYSKRGMQMASLFRYLDKLGTGELYFSLLPGDRAFSNFQHAVASGNAPYPRSSSDQKNKLANASTNRYQLAWQDNTQYNPYWSSNVNLNYVSDDYYLQDLNNGAPFANNNGLFADLLTTTQLTQTANVKFATQHWGVNAEVENFQTLHPITLTTTHDQYARLPEININGVYPESFLGLNYNLSSEITDFQHPLFENDFKTNLASVTGMRYHVAPSINSYWGRAWGYINPQVTLDTTAYSLTNPVTNLKQQHSMNRTLPIYDIDSGLYFDREVHFGKADYKQTLEPRLFYLNVPYVNQNAFPNFDSSLSPSLTFDQLFNTNRFQGYDRVGDANQLSVGVTSRFIKNSSGEDILDFSLGQIYYFRNRNVQINKEQDPAPALSTAETTKVSPIVGQLNWQFRHYWTATGNFAYDTSNHWMQNANLGVTYRSDNNHILSGSYSLVKQISPSTSTDISNLQQINLGLSWPITTRWQALSGVNYSIASKYAPMYLYGLQYNSCCWAIRALTSRRYIGHQSNGARQYDQSIYIQFLLTGLTAVGTSTNGSSSPTDILAYVIPGYKDNFGKTRLFKPS